MKGFIFKYENILKIREEKENDIKNELGKAIQERVRMLDKLTDTEKIFKDYLTGLQNEMSNGISAVRLRDITKEKRYYRELIHVLKNRLIKKDKEVDEIRFKLIEASKEKKIMEKLKERELEEYKQREKEAEEKMVDQIVTFNSSNKR